MKVTTTAVLAAKLPAARVRVHIPLSPQDLELSIRSRAPDRWIGVT